MAKQPAKQDMGLAFEVFFFRVVSLFNTDRSRMAGFVFDRNIRVERFESGQRILLEARLVFAGRNIAEGHEHRIARVVMPAVEIEQLPVAEFRYLSRVAAAVEMIGGFREQVTAHGMPENADRRTHGAFHFVIDDALDRQIAIRIFRLGEFEAMSFLGKIQFMQIG